MTTLWWAIIVAAIGCYLLKLAGVSLPESILNHPNVQRVAQLVFLLAMGVTAILRIIT